jgi:peptidoglycan-associated lipoprotein
MKIIPFRTLSLLVALTVGSGALTGCSWFGGSSDSSGVSDADLAAAHEARFGDGSIPTAEGDGMFKDIQFGYDSSSVQDNGRQNAEFNAKVLKNNSALRIQVEGHCDERGTNEYNLALGAARARAVKDILGSLGISASRLEAISYGEDVPLDPGHDESAWAKNRRVHLSAIGK